MPKHDIIDAAEDRLVRMDDRVHRAFQPYKESPPVKMLDLFSKLGDQPELRLISGALIAVGTWTGNTRMARAGLRMLVAHEAATFAKNRVKMQIDRTRPRSADGREDKKVRVGKHTEKELTSFPSGHSAGAVAVARAFSREFPEYAPAALGAAGFVALSQVPRCAHYPSDVAAGLVVGLAAEAAVSAAWPDSDGQDAQKSKAPAAAPASPAPMPTSA